LARSNCCKRHAKRAVFAWISPQIGKAASLGEKTLDFMKTALSLVVFLLLLTLAGFAEEIPSGPQPQAAVLSAAVPPLVQPIVVVPKAQKPVSTRKFWALTAFSAAMTVADIELTQNCLATVRGCYETDPLYGTHPTRARMYAINVPINAAVAYVSYKAMTGKRLSKLWAWPQLALTATHFGGVVTNITTRR
jgi:hypothetical protein